MHILTDRRLWKNRSFSSTSSTLLPASFPFTFLQFFFPPCLPFCFLDYLFLLIFFIYLFSLFLQILLCLFPFSYISSIFIFCLLLNFFFSTLTSSLIFYLFPFFNVSLPYFALSQTEQYRTKGGKKSINNLNTL